MKRHDKIALMYMGLFIVSMFSIMVLQDLMMKCEYSYFFDGKTSERVYYNSTLIGLMVKHESRSIPMSGVPIYDSEVYQTLKCNVVFDEDNIRESYAILKDNPRKYLKTIFKL
jgi:hypothetical protein